MLKMDHSIPISAQRHNMSFAQSLLSSIWNGSLLPKIIRAINILMHCMSPILCGNQMSHYKHVV